MLRCSDASAPVMAFGLLTQYAAYVVSLHLHRLSLVTAICRPVAVAWLPAESNPSWDAQQPYPCGTTSRSFAVPACGRPVRGCTCICFGGFLGQKSGGVACINQDVCACVCYCRITDVPLSSEFGAGPVFSHSCTTPVLAPGPPECWAQECCLLLLFATQGERP